MKRYRTPKVIEGQIKFQRGKLDDEIDMLVIYGDDVPRCDRSLVMQLFTSEQLTWDMKTRPSFIEELKRRGYDLDTLRFSIEIKIIATDANN